MSAVETFYFVLVCNGGCSSAFAGRKNEPRAHVRKRAAVVGWARTRNDEGKVEFDQDLCPRCAARREETANAA